MSNVLKESLQKEKSHLQIARQAQNYTECLPASDPYQYTQQAHLFSFLFCSLSFPFGAPHLKWHLVDSGGGVEFSKHAKLRLRESRLKTHEIHFTRDQQPAMQMPQLEGIVVFAASETERQDLHQNAAFCHLRLRVGRPLHDKCFSSSTGSHTWHGRA